ncbi:MAG: NAD-dependent DNA ligase LigA [Oscillospiraceae bacterium]|nr:NAD-dependent DNA ligase LigA [Oscillospiraceae bacterium]MDD6084973.1 NAD-dependent DNA ligase LigA [Oscillospiraceae bacterium]MDY3256971.1 NAD-dependent DNA ligase LigA [Ruminococcus callidus]
MDTKTASKKIDDLTSELLNYNHLYYDLDSPKISDYEYDMKLRELEKLEGEFPQFRREDSPTINVGGVASSSFESVEHTVPMLSLGDVFSYGELDEFCEKILKEYPDTVFSVEPKIDGLSVSLEYVNGKFIRGSTRGNGHTGEDITENLKKIKSIPMYVTNSPDNFELRGEVYMPKDSFELLQKETSGAFKNTRNAAAGSLRQKNPEITLKRKLGIFIFNVQITSDTKLDLHSSQLDYLKKLGFNVIPSYLCKNIDEIVSIIEKIADDKKNIYDFDIDGVVIKVDSLKQRESLGTTAKIPKWAIAYKYPPEEKETVIRDIKLTVGRTGIITPTAIFDTVQVSGTSVSRATLNNQSYINEKNVNIGDTVLVRKAGEIIPEIVRTIKHIEENGVFKIPDRCPICNSKVSFEENGKAAYCTNTFCPSQIEQSIIHFVSKNAMDITGLGNQIVKKLLGNGLIKSSADIYDLSKEQILELENFKEKSADNLIRAIEKSKSKNLNNLIFALGIRNVGFQTAGLLAKKFKTLDNFILADEESIVSIDGIGDVIAKNICNTKKDNHFLDNIEKLKNAGVNTVFIESSASGDGKLNGKTVVITGTFSIGSREKISEMITAAGGKVSSSVSKKTDYLFAGEKAGSKLSKAESLGIKIINEENIKDFLEV